MNLLPKDGETFYYPNFFTPEISHQLFNSLTTSIDWQQEPIKIFGKTILQPRLTALYGDSDKPYSYSNLTMHPKKWITPLLEIKKPLEKMTQAKFTTVLLNLYRNQKDSMGWHRDNEKELGPEPLIASISLGESREFQMRHYFDKTLKKNIFLENGSLLIMSGTSQQFWEHCLPKKSNTLSQRINLTFRIIKTKT